MNDTSERLRELAREMDQAGHERGADLAREAIEEIETLKQGLNLLSLRLNAMTHERDEEQDRCQRVEDALRTARRNAREQHRMTLRKFAQFCGVSPTELSRWTAEPIDRPPDLVCRR